MRTALSLVLSVSLLFPGGLLSQESSEQQKTPKPSEEFAILVEELCIGSLQHPSESRGVTLAGYTWSPFA